MILGSNGEKMSKSRGNVVNPDDIVNSHGADSLRLFEMFAGPLESEKPWSTTGIDGAYRFIARVFRLVDEPEFVEKHSAANSGELDYSYNFLVKKVTSDFESLNFNTAISAMMVFINDCYKAKTIYRPYLEGFVKMFSCICPFAGEEMWEKLGYKDCIDYEAWPTYDESKLKKETIQMAVSVNGKTRDVMEFPTDVEEEAAVKAAMDNPRIQAFIEGKSVRKVIFVKGRILNIVVG